MKNFSTKNFKKAFTLVEMLVSISIITIIMGIVFFGYGTFSDNLALSSAVQEISISMRQAQVYGLSVKGVNNSFITGYGIYFDKNDPTSYYIFNDSDNDGVFDYDFTCASGGECVEKDILRNGVKIYDICGTFMGSGQVEQCADWTDIKSMNITFVRPSPDAIIKYMGSNHQPFASLIGVKFKSGRVLLISPRGKMSSVTIENTGQVSVQ